MPTAAAERKLESLIEAITARGLDYHAIYRRILRGELKAVRRGSRWFVDPELLGSLAADKRVTRRDAAR